MVPPTTPRAALAIAIAANFTRTAIRDLTQSDTNLQPVVEASDCAALLHTIKTHAPRILLVSASLPSSPSGGALPQVLACNERGALVLLVRPDIDEDYLRDLMALDPQAVLSIDVDASSVVAALRFAAHGFHVYCPMVIARRDDWLPAIRRHELGIASNALTTQERRVLEQLAKGYGEHEIAARLAISERTLQVHLASARQKLGASSRTHAVSLAVASGLCSAGRPVEHS